MSKIFTVLIICFLIGCISTRFMNKTSEANMDIYSPEKIIELMKKVCDYQIVNPSHHYSKNKDFPNGWVPASFYTGVMATYYTTKDNKYLDQALKWAEENNWQPGPRLRVADDHCCGQTYLELYMIKKDPKMITPIKATFDSIMANPKPGREDWWWCDALFMGPPTLARLGAATGKKKYFNFMHEMYWDTAQLLFSKEDGFFYRDQRYFYRRTKHGNKVFWSRGNGWVMAGIARLLPCLPKKDSYRDWYVHLLKTMAMSVIKLQGEDGLWRSSLLDPGEFPAPETSGSGFFCYAITWGINNGLLDRDAYLPAVKKAWKGLVKAVHPNGKIGWVQAIGRNPDVVSYDDTHAYGAGAFLLAGSELIKLFE
jgi:unsaturated rhamnogalacturonyl hydrolase